MRIFSLIVACLSLATGVGCVSLASKFREMFEGTTIIMPNLTSVILNSSGWFPGGIFVVLAIFIYLLVLAKKSKIAGIVAVPTLIFMIGTAMALPTLLMSPISQMIRSLEPAQHPEDGAGQPAIRAESE